MVNGAHSKSWIRSRYSCPHALKVISKFFQNFKFAVISAENSDSTSSAFSLYRFVTQYEARWTHDMWWKVLLQPDFTHPRDVTIFFLYLKTNETDDSDCEANIIVVWRVSEGEDFAFAMVNLERVLQRIEEAAKATFVHVSLLFSKFFNLQLRTE